MIEQLAQRRNLIENAQNEEEDVDIEGAQDEVPLAELQNQIQDALVADDANRDDNVRLRNVDSAGVRQSFGNWQRDNTTPWNRPILAKPLDSAFFKTQCERMYVSTLFLRFILFLQLVRIYYCFTSITLQ